MATWEVVKFYYQTFLGASGSTLTASSTLTGTSVNNIYNMLEGDRWEAADTTTPMYITLYLGDLVTNGGFETNSLSPWIGWANAPGAALFATSITNPYAGSFKAWIDVTNGGTGYGDVHFALPNLSVKAGEVFQLSFAAKASVARNIQVRLVDHFTVADLTAEGLQTIAITTNWAVYTITFTITKDNADARYDFLLGSVVSVVSLDEIKMERMADADYLAIAGHNLRSIGASVRLQWSDDGVTYSGYSQDYPSSDGVYLKEFAGAGNHKYWRLRIDGAISAPPKMAICIWGMKTSLDFARASFDPNAEEVKANINIGDTGYLLGIHKRFTERSMKLVFKNASQTLYDKVKDWWNTSGLKNFFVAWEHGNNPNDVFLMRPDTKFNNPLVKRGLYRDITINLKGRKE